MAPIENDPVCADEDLDDDDDDESEQEEYLVAPAKRLDEIDENDVDEDPDQDHNDTSSSNLASASPSSSPQLTLAVSIAADPVSPLQTVAAAAAITLPVTDSSPDFKRQRIDTLAIPGINNSALKPLAVFDESRRLFQRLWTDEDEIELLQGFLDYTKKQRFNSVSGNAYHHDTSAFYDQIKSKLQLDFNKNQLVEKLRRLKKKYRTIISKMGSGKEYVFKSSHDQATFEICKKIWSTDGRNNNRVGGGGGLEDDDTNPNPNPNPNQIHNRHNNSVFAYCTGKKSGGSGKRFRGGSVKMQDVKPQFHHQLTTPMATPIVTGRDPSPIPCLIEETVRSCLPPLLKDLLQNCGGSSSRGGVGGMGINSLPFGLLVGGNLNSLSGSGGGGGGDVMEEKWRKQQIMELEVYSKRLELVQDEIKSALDELRRSSMQQQQHQQQGGAS